MSETLQLNLLSADFKANPYPAFAQARAQEPILQIKAAGGRNAWLITRYEDAEALLRDQRFSKNIYSIFSEEELAQNVAYMNSFRALSNHMLAADPPDHTRLRSLVNRAFTPALVEQWRERVQEITDELLDHVEAQGQMELISDFAFPLPMLIISEMLGIPAEDRFKFREWSNTLIGSDGSVEAIQRNQVIIGQFVGYLRNLISERRAHPTDDLVSRLVQAEAEGDKLSEQELIAMIFLLLVAGHETTVNLIGNGVLALLSYPEQLARLKADPALIKSAIEELLRYNGPLMIATIRYAREDLELGGKLIRRGEQIIVGLSSANHDAERFAEAEKLDITRKENHHLAFGKGIHFCLGAPLARLEGQIAIATLFRRLPNLRLNIDPQAITWRTGMLIHGVETLPVAF